MLEIRGKRGRTERGGAEVEAAPARQALSAEFGEVNTGADTDRQSVPEQVLSAGASTLPKSEVVAEVEDAAQRSRLPR